MSKPAQLKGQGRIVGNNLYTLPYEDIFDHLMSAATTAHGFNSMKVICPELSDSLTKEYDLRINLAVALARQVSSLDRNLLFEDMRRSTFGKILKPEMKEIENRLAARENR